MSEKNEMFHMEKPSMRQIYQSYEFETIPEVYYNGDTCVEFEFFLIMT